MAHTDKLKSGLTESLDREGTVGGEQEDLAGKVDVAEPKDVLSNSASAVHPANPNVSSGATNSSSASHPKKFSSVNINKKFLEKNSSTPPTAQSSSNFSAAKSGVANSKPVVQPTLTHSRLVTTKLTAVLPPSTLTGPGWSRPSSVAPAASTSNSPPVPSGATPPTSTSGSSHTTPQLPHVGKVILPQPRGSSIGPNGTSKKDGSGQPVWGRSRGSFNNLKTEVQNDFPTAAEVAQVRSARMVEKQEAAQSAAAHKQALRAEADAFRGVHLDPNAHHWDEMEEDDDNFLGEVIDFGDGRQYTVQPVESQPSQQDGPQGATQDQHARQPVSPPPSSIPVRKEDRFADDFDRSWPRTRKQPTPNHREHPPHEASSSSQALLSQESSRVLFNERSNRLEPYSGRQNSHFPSRGGRSDMPSPTEPKAGRDAPSHSQSQNVQLLQKSESTAQRPRKFGSSEPLALDMDGVRDKASWRDGPSPSSSIYSGRPPSQASQNEYGRHWSRDDTGRRPSFSNASVQSKDRGRQLPPHMSQRPPSSPAKDTMSSSPVLSRDGKLSPVSHGAPTSPSFSTHSLTSSIVQPSSLPPVIDDEARQAAMHTAAERARIRRQQEEEERENQKARARKKATELEAKIQAGKDAKTAEEPIVETTVEQQTSSETPNPLPVKSSWGRTPSVRGGQREASLPSRPIATRRKSSNAGYNDSSMATQTESWRAKAAPLPPASLPPSETVTKPPPPTLVAEVEPLTVQEGEDIEVIDFSEFGKFVGAPEPLPEPPLTSTWSDRVPPAERQDLVEARHREPPIPAKSDVVSWRRKTEDGSPSSQDRIKPTPIDLTSKASEEVPSTPTTHSRPNVNSSDNSNQNSHFNAQRSPRANAFREASMSALDDVMSRIKGALDHIHEMPKEAKKDEVKETPLPSSIVQAPPSAPAQKLEQSKSSRWLPPALRPRDVVSNPFGLDREDPVTVRSPPSPNPGLNAISVRLPQESKIRGPLTKRQFNSSRYIPSPFRWDILSWHPPVEGMNKRDLSINDILFRKPLYLKGKPRYRVLLPVKTGPSHIDTLTPKVNIPNRSTKVLGAGAFGRHRGADEISSWRRSEPTPDSAQSREAGAVLDTVSRSPPPVSHSDLPIVSSSPAKAEVQLSSPEHGLIVRSRHQPKMPAGSDIGFYRAVYKESAAVEAKTTVTFTVSSELDGGSDQRIHLGSPVTDNTLETGPNSPVPALVQSKTESKSSDTSPENVPLTPPIQASNATWTKAPLTFPIKESTSRAPDPEHLKIVWSKKSETQDELPSINSLEGIADDFTTVPFTIQDVKSEDGETPPPTAPSRMSLSEVTRAFQQVPSRPDSTHPRPNQLSSTLSSPVPAPSNRQQSFGLPQTPQSNMRSSSYGPYQSPVMSHSPAPVMYAQGLAPSPVPGRMMVNGHSAHYAQPLWMPIPAGPVGQNPGPMMRPLHSPFPAQVMSYPSPGTSMYAPQMTNGHNHVPQQNGHPQGRGRGNVPMMSPVMSPVNPSTHPNMMYPASPVMLPAPPVMQGYPPPPLAVGGGRGQIRNGYENMSMQHPPPSGPQQPATYAPMPSYVRPAW